MPLRSRTPRWGLKATLVVCALVAPAAAQPKGKTPPPAPAGDAKTKDKPAPGGKEKVKNFDLTAMDLNGRMRTPQLLYFLERANEELERASLEKRSFIPHMVRSVEDEHL
jgi:hypothetical protein